MFRIKFEYLLLSAFVYCSKLVYTSEYNTNLVFMRIHWYYVMGKLAIVLVVFQKGDIGFCNLEDENLGFEDVMITLITCLDQ